MEFAIIGGGSLGLMWTARVLLAGISPTLIVRSEEQKELIHRQGFVYTEDGESRVLHPVVESQESYQGVLPPWVVLTVKQPHIVDLLPFLKRYTNMKGYILSLQNGLGHFELLSKVYTPDRVILGSTSDGALRHTANHVERTGYGEIWFGQQGVECPPSSIKSNMEHLKQQGLSIAWDSEIMMRLWRKCIINSTINPLTGILNVENGHLLQSESTLSIMKELYHEGCMVAKTMGFQFYEDLWQEIQNVCRNTSRNRSSMLQDLLGKRRTEIEYINGYIVRHGEQSGVLTSRNQLMVQLIHAKEELNRIMN